MQFLRRRRKLPRRSVSSLPVELTISIHPHIFWPVLIGITHLRDILQTQFLNEDSDRIPVDWTVLQFIDSIVLNLSEIADSEIKGGDNEG